jgi:hypothetical protein
VPHDHAGRDGAAQLGFSNSRAEFSSVAAHLEGPGAPVRCTRAQRFSVRSCCVGVGRTACLLAHATISTFVADSRRGNPAYCLPVCPRAFCRVLLSWWRRHARNQLRQQTSYDENGSASGPRSHRRSMTTRPCSRMVSASCGMAISLRKKTGLANLNGGVARVLRQKE